MAKIFISYSRVDKTFVKELVDRLRRMYNPGDIWYDDGLHGGDLWWEEILDQIAKADIFIYVLSNESVQSDYCQAEFTEARRLQKAIITVQARDRTKLTDALKDIHYINMTNGVTDGDALTDLYRSIDKQVRNVRRRHALWAGRTPKPSNVEENLRPANSPEVQTPTLQLPKAEQETPPTRVRYTNPTVLAGLFVLVVAVITGVFGLWQGVFADNDTPTPTEIARVETESLSEEDARATGAAQAYQTVTALAPTNTPTATPSESATTTPTWTPTATLTVTSTNTPTQTSTTTPTETVTSSPSPTPTTTPTGTFTPTSANTVTATNIFDATTTAAVQSSVKQYPCSGTVTSSGTSNQLYIVYVRASDTLQPIASVSRGSSVTILGDTVETGRRWYQIKYGTQDARGWIWDSYIQPSTMCPP